MIGLGNADNTSDANKPISTATQSALDLKASIANVDASLNLKANLESPTLTGTPSAPTAAANTNSTQIATTEFVKTAVANLVASAPAALDTLNELAMALGSDASFSTTVSTAIGLKAPIESPTFTGTVSGISKGMVGLGNADNTSDANKPISTATQSALDLKASIDNVDASLNLKANLVSPTFTGPLVVSSGDVSFNSKLLVNGVATMNDNLLVAKDVSLNSKLFVSGNVSMNSNLNVKGNVNIGQNDNCGNMIINGSIIPFQANTWDLGSQEYPFKSLYVSNQTITLVGIKDDGNTTTTGISVDGGMLKLNTDAGSDQIAVMSIDNKTGFGKGSLLAAATIDVSGNALISGDVSFNSKLYVANDVSFNKNVDISGNLVINGNLSVFQQRTTSIINTSINNYEILSTKDISLNGNLVVSSDTQLNSKLRVINDASFNGRVDICGNLYARYPINSIPTTAIIDGVTLSYVDASLNLKAPINNPTFTGTVSGITKSMVGLGNADNTSDANKPISTATQSALDLKASIANVDASLNLKANLVSPALTGTPSAPTAAANTNSTQIATTEFVQTAVANLVASAPATLDTLNELAAALGSDASFSTTVSTSLGLKAPINNPTFTGTVGGITKSMVGLGNADNTSDASKPISTATQSALDLKASIANVDASLNLKANIESPTFTGTVSGISKNMVGLGNADNTSDANKPVSTATQSALDLKASIANVDASLNLKANLESPTFTGTVSGISKSMIGLGNADNTSDANKPISTATQSALDLKASIANVDASLNLKANLESPALTGTPSAPTASANTNSTQIATTEFVQTAVANLVASAPTTLDTLNELAAALGSDASFSTTVSNAIGLKAPINNPTFTGTVSGITQSMVGLGNVDNTSDANKPISTATQTALDAKAAISYVDPSLNLKANLESPTFTGAPVAPTASSGTNTTQIATTAFVTTAVSNLIANDVSFNNNIDISGNLRISGNLSVFQQQTTSIINTTVNNYQILSTKDISLNGNLVVSSDASFNSKLFVVGDVSFNSKLRVAGDASFNGRVDICGNFYAQYPASSIPSSAIIGGVGGGGGSSIDLSVDISVNGLTIGCGTNDISTNSVVGYQALLSNTTGSNNTAFGYKALIINTTGNNNTAVGFQSGDANTSGTNNTFIGANTDTSGTTWSSSTAIGANAKITASNQITLGTSMEIVYIPGKLSGVSDASFVGRVDICGNFYAQYPESSIPSSAIIGGVGSGSSNGVDISSNQTISGLKTFSNGINVGNTFLQNISWTDWTKLGQDIDAEAADDQCGWSVSLSDDGSIVAVGALLNDGNGSNSGHCRVYQYNSGTNAWTKLGQDIDGEAGGNQSGVSVSLSANGTIVAIGAFQNAGVNGSNSGHCRVWQYNSGTNTWTKIGQDIDGEAANDWSGWSVSLSSDGTIVAIGAYQNAGVNGSNSGHCRIYQNISGTWTKLGQDLDGEATNNQAGRSVALSANGTIVAIGAAANTGVNGANSGHCRVWQYNSGTTTWTQLGQDIDGEAASDQSGYSVSLNDSGSIVAIGAIGNSGNRGHCRVWQYNSGTTTWTQLGQDLDGEAGGDQAGYSVSLSANGLTVAIGAYMNDGNGSNTGHCRVYQYNSGTSTWTPVRLDIDGEGLEDRSGFSVSLSADGTIVAIGAILNDGAGLNSGHCRVYSVATSSKLVVKNIDVQGYLALTQDLGVNGLTIGCGSSDISTNSVVGYQALFFNGPGYQNNAFGYQALYNNTNGYQNNAFGYLALRSNTTGNENSAFGYFALNANTTGGRNNAFGLQSLNANTSGSNNCATGYQALFSNTTAGNNTATGYQALYSNTTGHSNVATGYQALLSNTTATSNTANGFEALRQNTTGSQNVANGYYALRSNTTASFNSANGYLALSSNTTGQFNTGNGREALYLNTTGNNNSANGAQSLRANTTGTDNVANGTNALYTNTTGNYNTANGSVALYSNTTGSLNTANGFQALYFNTTGIRNVANGYYALASNTTASNNTANGAWALSSNTTGGNNSANGAWALLSNTTGNLNSANGYEALYFNTTGTNNTASGYRAGYNNTTGTYNTYLGSGTDISGTSATWTSSTAIGANAKITASNQITLGTASEVVSVPGWVSVVGNVTASSFLTSSDYRIKDYVTSLSDCSFTIDKLRPVTYQNKVTKQQDIGLIAHEVQEHFPFLVSGEKDGETTQSVNYTSLIGLLIHEIKVLKQNQIQPDVIPNLQKHIQNLEERLRLLEK
jgi:cytoskeletal protein CcmA (bactofilin family)